MKIIKVGDEMRLTNMDGNLNGMKVVIEEDCREGIFEVKLLEAPSRTPWRIGDVIAVEYLELKRAMTEFNRDDIRLMLIREFANGEEFNLGRSLTGADFQERIRVAIMRTNKSTTLFHDTGQTYADIFMRLFGSSVERRKKERPTWMTDPGTADFLADE